MMGCGGKHDVSNYGKVGVGGGCGSSGSSDEVEKLIKQARNKAARPVLDERPHQRANFDTLEHLYGDGNPHSDEAQQFEEMMKAMPSQRHKQMAEAETAA